MIDDWGFGAVTYKRDRTFNLYSKIDDHANDVHDYLKYIKFGYGRATDDVSTEIRHGRLSREDGIELIRQYDAVEPSSLEFYCEFLGISVSQFYDSIEALRDGRIWARTKDGWEVTDSITRHEIGPREEVARAPQSTDRVFSEANRHLYFNSANPPLPSGEPALDQQSREFKVL